MKIITVAALTLLSASSAMASVNSNIVTNGSFEDNLLNPNDGWGLYSILPGWTQTTGDLFEVHHVATASGGTFNTSYDGSYYVELNANNLGAISQTLNTTAGQSYNLTFGYSGRADSGYSSSMDVMWGNSTIASLTLPNNSGWHTYSFTLLGNAAPTDLKFVSTGPSAQSSYGSYLDGVSVTAVPEPETYAMFLAGLGLMGAIARRRRIK